MIGKELKMEVERYNIVDDRISLLSNILPSNELKEEHSSMNWMLFLSNLTLRRKNKKLNKFNNRLHEQIKNNRNNLIINNKIGNEANFGIGTLSRNNANKEGDDILISQTLEIENKSVLRQIDKETDNLNKTNDLDKNSEFKSEQIDSPFASKNLENWDRDSEEWEELSNKELGNSRKMSPENKNTKTNHLQVNNTTKK